MDFHILLRGQFLNGFFNVLLFLSDFYIARLNEVVVFEDFVRWSLVPQWKERRGLSKSSFLFLLGHWALFNFSRSIGRSIWEQAEFAFENNNPLLEFKRKSKLGHLIAIYLNFFAVVVADHSVGVCMDHFFSEPKHTRHMHEIFAVDVPRLLLSHYSERPFFVDTALEVSGSVFINRSKFAFTYQYLYFYSWFSNKLSCFSESIMDGIFKALMLY